MLPSGKPGDFMPGLASWLYPFNIVIIGLILLPNLLFLFFPPVQVSGHVSGQIPGEAERTVLWTAVGILEFTGRIGVFTLPLFWRMETANSSGKVALAVMGLCVAVYYWCWLRYFMAGCDVSLLFAPLGVLPLPMALFPVIYFFSVAVLLHSWPVGIAAVTFAVGHILESSRHV